VLTQFSITICFISILLIMNLQTNYLINKDLHFNKKNVIYIDELSENIRKNIDTIRAELTAHPGIINVSLSDFVPGVTGALTSIEKANTRSTSLTIIHEIPVDEYFIDTYKIKIKKGRNFHQDSINDKEAILLNQKAVDLLGESTFLNDSFQVYNHKCKFIGIVENFHYESLHDSVSPLVLSINRTIGRKMSIETNGKFKSEDIRGVISGTISRFDKNFLFNYSLISDDINQLYKLELKNKRLMFYMSVIAVIISFIGLYSFVSFIVIQRTKEIGIRKVLGEEPSSIILMLIKETGYWIILANIIALPLAFFSTIYWLNKFTYHIENYTFVILIAALSVFLFACITIYFQALKIAYKNPVYSLRYE